MQSLEFLGGKYQQPEQIIPGDVQTFRAQQASSGRTVYVHRISTTGNEPEQTVLLRLLLTSMFRSPSARNQVLDFSDEPGFCYVVTESTPQCLLLREWLQYELDQASDAPRVAQPEAQPLPPPPAAVRPPAPAPAKLDSTQFAIPIPSQPPPQPPGEFTRMFAGGSPAGNLPPAKPAEMPKEPPRPAPVPPPAAADPGEFTRFMQGGLPPAAPPKSTPPPEPYRSTDRPSQSGFVQRPNSITPAPGAPSPGPSEFTKMFSSQAFGPNPGSDSPTPRPSSPPRPKPFEPATFPDSRSDLVSGLPREKDLPDLAHRKSDLHDMFNSAPEVSSPIPSASKEPGAYTQMFGKGNQPPPNAQTPAAVPTAPLPGFDDPLMPPCPRPSGNGAPPSSGPSEFTRVMQGNRPPETPGQEGARGGSGGGQGGSGGGAPPIDVKITPLNPNMMLHGGGMGMPMMGGAGMGSGGMAGGGVGGMASGPHVSQGGASLGHASAHSPVGSAQVSGSSMMPHMGGIPPLQMKAGAPPKQAQAAAGLAQKGAGGLASKRNLLILFIILALLAIALVVIVARSK